MLAVIADDFTGAAELAGIGLRYGLSVALFMGAVETSDADLVVVSTDSRSLNKNEALHATRAALKGLLPLNPEWVYKKTDSVLRGYVVDELRVQMEVMGLTKALLLPANPSLGRTIFGGKYYVHHSLISDTSFATDPEFAVTDASVLKMLDADSDEKISVQKHDDPLPADGIVAGEVCEGNDIMQWLKQVDNTWLIAGAGDCFEALLQQQGCRQKTGTEPGMLKPYLYVSGTSFATSKTFIKSVQEQERGVHYLSASVIEEREDQGWFQQVATTIVAQQKAIIAIDETMIELTNLSALQLRTAMAEAVKKIVADQEIKELFIEGGATAAAIFEALNMHHFTPTNELARGVVRMKGTNDLYVTVKPGSYALPKTIKDLYIS
ncbi:MAG: four-carbon acid sugar kinase family protein [Chitinophagaceae bacterium]